MAGGPQTYIIAGAKVRSSYLAVATLGSIAALATMMGGGKKAEAPVAQQIKQLPSEEGDFVAKFMAELEKDDKPAKAH